MTMKWVNGYTREKKWEIKSNWHLWFAWYPVVLSSTPEGRSIKAWLQYVERKGKDMGNWIFS
jgi:hypothetical protein